MASKPTVRNRIVDFDTEGVTFIFPPGLDDLFVLRKPPFKPPPDKKFVAKRTVINVKLLRVQNGEAEPATTFDPPIQIEIHYKKEDDIDGKECAFWSTGTKRWEKFTSKVHGFDPVKYDSKIHKNRKDDFVGFGVATISDWPDPVIGWGP